MKKLTKKEINSEFERVMETIEDYEANYDMGAFETVFQAGIDFVYKRCWII
jgi:hypothetical protein